MKCPVCGTPDLLMTERQGVEIDYCPNCRGVWLDRGELDKLIERTDGAAAASAPMVRGEHDRSRRESGGRSNGHANAQEYRDDDRGYWERRDNRDNRDKRDSHDRQHGDDNRRRYYDRPRKKKSLFEMFDFD
ncbi:TFIIB-type zinc ribbon-containing protein [Pandoraea anhela]|uniref:Transcription factor zinc-finger domain-containing protein n=1 Tax=Pandoraea anhela TaxID=2508295 RepID=A0A5E4XS82_9BURK|nr:zf-TFIIB domain-containing protein [Pandoraea anhela]VVE39133.1 hypothetical protein PAN31108_04054 [Pandoraea anhela]